MSTTPDDFTHIAAAPVTPTPGAFGSLGAITGMTGGAPIVQAPPSDTPSLPPTPLPAK